MDFKLSEYIDNDVRNYPLWALIFGSVVMILLAIGHAIRYKQSSRIIHIFFVLSLICLSVQYICATQNINTAFLTLIANSIAIVVNIILFCVWIHSTQEYIDFCTLGCICYTIYFFSFTFVMTIIISFISLDDALFSEDNHESLRVDLFLWYMVLFISIAGSFIMIFLTVIFQFCLGSEECKRRKRLRLGLLSLLSLLLLMSEIGTLFEIPLLYVIPFLLFHIIPMLTRDSISGYYRVPVDSNV
jgi:hypothetical protein